MVMGDDIESRRKVAAEIYGVLRGIIIPKDIIVVKLKDIDEWKEVPQAFVTRIMKKGRVIYEKQN